MERALPVIWLVVASAGCGACTDAHVGDGGHDGGSRDAGPRDGGARDAGPRDAGRDGGPDDPQWTVPDGLPAGCTFEVALHPERIPAFGWVPCFDGRAGCQELVVDWGDWSVIDTLRVYSDAFVGRGEPLAAFMRPWGANGRELFAVRPEDGSVVWAFRFEVAVDACMPSTMALSRDDAWYRAGSGNDALDDVESIVRSSAATPGVASLLHIEHPVFVNAAAQRIRVSATGMIALEIQPAYRVGTIRDGVFRLTASPGSAIHPLVVDDYLLFDAMVSGRHVVDVEMPDGSVGPYLDVADADVFSLRTDGEWLAWVEGRMPLASGLWGQTTVRAARFTPDPAGLAPRTVLELGEYGMGALAVGGGWVVSGRNDAGTYVRVAVDLETGEQRVIPTPEGYLFADDPSYVTRTEVGLAVYTEGGVGRTIWRVALR